MPRREKTRAGVVEHWSVETRSIIPRLHHQLLPSQSAGNPYNWALLK
jgi:hypothetical protein